MEYVRDGEFVTGRGRMDRDHKRMVVLINHLADGIENERGSAFFELMLGELVRQTTEHFSAEEELMASQRYARTRAHKAEHALLLRQVRNLEDWLAWGPMTAAQCRALLEFFEYSLVAHIMSADQCFSKMSKAVEQPCHPDTVALRPRARL